MPPTSLPDKVVAIHAALDEAGIPHAFGGAIALAFYEEPRATIDIDVNVFVPTEDPRVLEALTAIGVQPPRKPEVLKRDGQDRLWWDKTAVDVFFAYDDFHDRMRQRLRRVPYGDVEIPILGPEELLVCKASFNRAKDWLDIDQMIVATPDLDADAVRHWLARLVGEGDERWRRTDELLTRLLAR